MEKENKVDEKIKELKQVVKSLTELLLEVGTLVAVVKMILDSIF